MTLVEQLRKLSAENQSPRDCIDEAADVIENLTALINRLCRQLNRVAPNNDVAVKAAEYLHRNNLLGTSLRRDDEGVGMVMDMIRNAGNTATDGHCTLGEDLCNCGGDVPAVRADCSNWKRHNANVTGLAPGKVTKNDNRYCARSG